jgi:hypothetical protein
VLLIHVRADLLGADGLLDTARYRPSPGSGATSTAPGRVFSLSRPEV